VPRRMYDAIDEARAPTETNPFVAEQDYGSIHGEQPRRRRRSKVIVAAGALVIAGAAVASRRSPSELNRLPVPLDLANRANFDDDAALRDGCVTMDSDLFCGDQDGALSATVDLFAAMLSTTKASLLPMLANARAVCEPACDGDSFFMPCLWEAAANLPDVCAATFEALPPAASPVKPARPQLAAPDLLSCDEHAFCMACGAGGCETVLATYGSSGGASEVFPEEPASQTMALSALLAIGRDLPALCESIGVPFAGASTYAR